MKRKFKLVVAIFVVIALGLSSCGIGNSDDSKKDKTLKEGVYTASFEGMGGDVTVEVTCDKNGITDIKIPENYETPGVGLYAQEVIKKEILDRQTLMVDDIAGATVTSTAVKMAVSECLKQADWNINAWKNIDDKVKKEYPSELSADVVVVGGGGAGLAAAVSAVQKGASVIVVEKMGFLGGNTVVCGGIYNCPDPELQEPAGIEDSPELFKEQTLTGGDNVANPKLAKILTSKAYEGLNWLKSLKAPFKDTITQGPGSLYPRTHVSLKPLGTGMIEAYIEFLNENTDRCQIVKNTEVIGIDIENNVAKGVTALNKDGSELKINANKGVIVATGGFAGNKELRQKYNVSGKWPNLTGQPTTNVPGDTGDGIKMLEDVAEFVDMEHIQLLHMCNPQDGTVSGICLGKGVAGELFLNKDGNRFVREDGRRDEICLAVMKQPGQMFYDIQSSESIDDPSKFYSLEGIPLNTMLEKKMFGWIVADDLEDLANKLNMPVENVKKSFADYNKGVETKNDKFGRKLLVSKIEKPKFYAYPRTVSVHHTMGGVKINENAEVVGVDGKVIQGLYAAGEVTGGIHGSNRLGGNAVVDTVVFGRIAGENCAGR